MSQLTREECLVVAKAALRYPAGWGHSYFAHQSVTARGALLLLDKQNWSPEGG